MDPQKTFVNRLPYSGAIFCLIVVAMFLLCRSHDQQVWHKLKQVHAQHLLIIEAPIYEDFYKKRLAIEQQGSEALFAEFQSAIKLKNFSTISRIILSDRSFRPFLIENNTLFLSKQEAEVWRTHSQKVTQLLTRLCQYQLALIPEHFGAEPQAAKLLSYLFAESSLINLLSNLLLLMLWCTLLEPRTNRLRFWLSLSGVSLIHGCLYLLIADSLSKPLSGFNVVIYFAGCVCLGHYLNNHLYDKKNLSLFILIVSAALLIAKTIVDIITGTLNNEQIAGTILFAGIGTWLGWRHHPFIWRRVASSPSITNALSENVRQKYTEALTALTRFNFSYARSRLRPLTELLPGATQIMNSAYHAEKLHPEDPHFKTLAENRISTCTAEQNYPEMLTIYKDIQKYAGNKQAASQCISADHYLQMLALFLIHNNTDKAEQVFILLALAGETSIIKNACLLLIKHFEKYQLSAKQKHYQAFLANL